MKLKNTKYILLLLAGIMLATGCGCGKGDGKGGAGGDVTELEATQEKLLGELKPLFLEWKKESRGGAYDESISTKAFEKAFTSKDKEHNSFVNKWKIAKALLNKGDAGIVMMEKLREDAVSCIDNATTVIESVSTLPKEKAYHEKYRELYRNTLKMIDIILDLDTDSGDSKKD